jgi:uncharacterized protein YcbK (DUF882 family)
VSGQQPYHLLQRCLRLALAVAVALTMLLPQTTVTATAASGDRTLYLYHTHTKQTGRFTFKRNGQFDQGVLKQLNVFLADWRTKEPTKMDPALFDLLWSVYQDVGASQPINIVSSYRSPKTNAMLASKSSGVADNSQHMKGKAIDFFIPGVNLSKLRESVMRHQVGGIGYYPTSGSPFVHADTGSVRAWPRMTRAQLKKVFPDGRTLHLPTDGKPLSNEGRAYAQAEWQKCHSVPCNGSPITSGGGATTMYASLNGEAPVPATKPRTLMDIFSAGTPSAPQASEPQAEIQLASLGGDPEQRVVSTFEILAPVPAIRGGQRPGGIAENGAPIPAQKSERVLMATLYTPATSTTALDALEAIGAPAPQSRVLMTGKPDMVTAYVSLQQDPDAERALQMIIARETTASLPATKAEVVLEPTLHTASIGGHDSSLGALKGMFDLTFNALTKSAAPETVASAVAGLAQTRQPNSSIELRPIELVAPELDHVNETLVHPVFMAGNHFAVMTEAEGYLDKGTELGPLSSRIGFLPEPAIDPTYDRFVIGAPVISVH